MSLVASNVPDEWAMPLRCFLKRPLLAHKLGVVDDKYVRQACDLEAVVGRKIRMSKTNTGFTLFSARKTKPPPVSPFSGENGSKHDDTTLGTLT